MSSSDYSFSQNKPYLYKVYSANNPDSFDKNISNITRLKFIVAGFTNSRIGINDILPQEKYHDYTDAKKEYNIATLKGIIEKQVNPDEINTMVADYIKQFYDKSSNSTKNLETIVSLISRVTNKAIVAKKLITSICTNPGKLEMIRQLLERKGYKLEFKEKIGENLTFILKES